VTETNDGERVILSGQAGETQGSKRQTAVTGQTQGGCCLNPEAAGLLADWYRLHARALPWRKDRSPYSVWLSEIMLQQTRIEAVIPYYARFLRELPSVRDLAECGEDRLMKLWEGLGYYSRARNLQKAARIVMGQYGGVFPQTHEGILGLPGIGEYTAGAIASICFGLPTPAVDGNVLRVCARLLEMREPVGLPDAKRRIGAALRALYLSPEVAAGEAEVGADRSVAEAGAGADEAEGAAEDANGGQRGAFPHCRDDGSPATRPVLRGAAAPGELTQALMELGETVCLPNAAPNCPECPLRALCVSCRNGTSAELPVRTPKKAKRDADVTVWILRHEGKFAVEKRPESGLLAGMWQFPNAEKAMDEEQAADFLQTTGARPIMITAGPRHTHVFTHIRWHMRSFVAECGAAPETFAWATAEELRRDYALPTAFRWLLGDLS
jgi:A/G-specific adenine glycosylase